LDSERCGATVITDDVLIEGATVLTMDADNRIVAPGWVLVRGGSIAEIDDRPIVVRGVRRLDGSGTIALPGFINAHTHLFQTLIRGLFDELPFIEWLRRIYRCGLSLERDDWRVSAELGATEALHSGVTTIVDHQFLHDGTVWSDAIIAGARQAGVRVVLARTSMDLADPAPAAALESVEASLKAIDELLGRYVEAISDNTVRILGGPNTPGVSATDRLSVAAARHARSREIGIGMHIAESRAALDAVERRYGVVGVVRWLDQLDALPPGTIAAHAVHLTPDEIEILARRRVAVVHNPISNLYLGDGIAPLSELLAAGVVVALGTDGAASNGSQDLFEVMKMGLLLSRIRGPLARAVTPLDVLRMATIDGARAVGLDDVVGSLEPGKRADITLVSFGSSAHSVPLNNIVTDLILSGRPSDVSTVLVDGQIVLDHGHLTTMDEDALVAVARLRGVALAERLTARSDWAT
jgi:5-methylthioadenosine/S-adenosylhomocysteine deaminase